MSKDLLSRLWPPASGLRARRTVETSHFAHDFAPSPDDSPRRRQTFDQTAAIALSYDTGIGDYHDPAIGRCAHQTPESLLEPKSGVREHVLAKGIATSRLDRLTVCGRDRFRR